MLADLHIPQLLDSEGAGGMTTCGVFVFGTVLRAC